MRSPRRVQFLKKQRSPSQSLRAGLRGREGRAGPKEVERGGFNFRCAGK